MSLDMSWGERFTSIRGSQVYGGYRNTAQLVISSRTILTEDDARVILLGRPHLAAFGLPFLDPLYT